nr:PREDICTED: uncharacterized protein LOC103281487 isoform X2 [Anolis carolinensis]|eukprot:XP_008121349.1 PREDICTED: uncharacterized protein LOC103281487 isoform X2 [Anolis carolinensis]
MSKKEASKGKGGKKAGKQKKSKEKLTALMGIPCPDEFQGDMPPWMREPFPDEMWEPEGDMPSWMMDRYSDEMWGPDEHVPPDMREPFPEPRFRGPMPPGMRGPFPGPRFRGPMPPGMRGPFPGPRFREPMPPEMRDHLPGPRSKGPMRPEMRGPFPGPRSEGPMPPEMRRPLPRPRSEGPMPPEMRDHLPWPRGEGHMPPEMRDHLPWPRGEGPMPPEMRDHLPGPRSGPMPPEMRDHLPGPRSEGPMPPEMRDHLPWPRGEGHMPPEMRDHLPWPRGEGPMPPEMRDHLPGPRSGPMPPEMRDHLPGPRSEGPMHPEMRDHFPGLRSEGPMPPEMHGSFPGPQRREPLFPHLDGMCEHRGPVPPMTQGMSQNEMCEPRRNVPPWAGGPNAPPCAPWPEAGVDAGKPGPSPAVWQEEWEKYDPAQGENYSFPSGSHSSDHFASSKVANDHYLQESAARILESFGLTNEDLEELSLYPEDQLKPENMPEILKEIRMKKAAHQLPELPSQEPFGGDGFNSPSAAQTAMAPVISESWRMNCPTPSMISDYNGSSPRLFPHTCALCKIECKHLRGWLLHLNTAVHLESCRQLCQQYPEWKLEDTSFNGRSENQTQSHWWDSSSLGHSSSGQVKQLSRSRSRSPLHRREKSPAEAVGNPKNDPQPAALSALVEKSVSQAMSMLQTGGTGAAGLAVLPSLQLDSAALSLGLVSMMQLVATQVVQTVLSSQETASEQAKLNTTPLTPQPSTSASGSTFKTEAAAKIVPPPAGGVQQWGPKRVLICGHGVIAQASRRAERSLCGSQLGLRSSLVSIEWLGFPGLFWDQLLPTLTPYLEASPPPDIVVLHLGENDVVKWTSMALSLRIREDLARIREKVPGIGLLWSFFLERLACPPGENLQRYRRARYKINRDVKKAVEAAGGASIPHSSIRALCPNLYQRDGVRLSDTGCDHFLKNLKQGLMDFLHSKGE